MTPRPDTSQILGCLYGGALGDAFASASESSRVLRGVPYTPSWQLTDDTQLTLATCRAMTAHGGVSAEKIAAQFVKEDREGKLTGLGSSTLGALRALRQGAHWGLSGIQGERAAGNGAAMRIAPLALTLDLEEWGEKQRFDDVVKITHKNEEALAGARALAVGLVHMLEHPESTARELYGVVAEHIFDSHTRDRFEELSNEPLDYELAAERIGTSGFAAHSVPMAFVAATMAYEQGLEAALAQIVACGGDTDTIASMAGQLFGVARGVDALPSQLELVHDRSTLDEVFGAFARRFVTA